MVVQPKECRACWQLTLLKIGKGSECDVVLQSSAPVWFRTHWVGGRQVLCPGVGDDGFGCPVCSLYSIGKVSGFVIVTAISGTTVRPFLFEVSDSSWARLRMLSEMAHLEVTSGLFFSAARKGFNRPLILEPISQRKGMPGSLSTERSLLGAVAVLFSLPVPAAGDSSTAWWASCLPYVGTKIRQALERASK